MRTIEINVHTPIFRKGDYITAEGFGHARVVRADGLRISIRKLYWWEKIVRWYKEL